MGKNSTRINYLASIIITGTLTLAACSPGTHTNTKTVRNGCQDWIKEKHGEEKCTDRSSSYYGHYLFNGMHYGNRSSLVDSSPYKSTVNGTTTGSQGESSKGKADGTQSNGKSSSNSDANTNTNTKGNGGNKSNGGLKGGFGSGSRGSGAS